MELTIKINTEDNLDLEKIEKDCKDISTSTLKKVVDSIKKIETAIQKVIDISEFKDFTDLGVMKITQCLFLIPSKFMNHVLSDIFRLFPSQMFIQKTRIQIN